MIIAKNWPFQGCKRENRFDIPQAYVLKASDPNTKPFYVGRIELMMKPKTETSKCLPVQKT
uniref:Uncharacterized protein n=1 Tax=Romanomermis culicivorax TaxID=13658 RepID=A0A915L590_ROMCU